MRVLFLGARCPESEWAAALLAREVDTTICLSTWGEPLPNEARRWTGDLIVSYRSRWIVPAALLGRAQRAVNFHPGSPRYPGIGATNFALYENAHAFGATLHHMLPRVDSGPIIATRYFPLSRDETLERLTRRTYLALDSLYLEFLTWLNTDCPFPVSVERWSRPAFTRRELNALCECTANMPTDELERRWRATYMPGLPERFLARLNGVPIHSPIETAHTTRHPSGAA